MLEFNIIFWQNPR